MSHDAHSHLVRESAGDAIDHHQEDDQTDHQHQHQQHQQTYQQHQLQQRQEQEHQQHQQQPHGRTSGEFVFAPATALINHDQPPTWQVNDQHHDGDAVHSLPPPPPPPAPASLAPSNPLGAGGLQVGAPAVAATAALGQAMLASFLYAQLGAAAAGAGPQHQQQQQNAMDQAQQQQMQQQQQAANPAQALFQQWVTNAAGASSGTPSASAPSLPTPPPASIVGVSASPSLSLDALRGYQTRANAVSQFEKHFRDLPPNLQIDALRNPPSGIGPAQLLTAVISLPLKSQAWIMKKLPLAMQKSLIKALTPSEKKRLLDVLAGREVRYDEDPHDRFCDVPPALVERVSRMQREGAPCPTSLYISEGTSEDPATLAGVSSSASASSRGVDSLARRRVEPSMLSVVQKMMLSFGDLHYIDAPAALASPSELHAMLPAPTTDGLDMQPKLATPSIYSAMRIGDHVHDFLTRILAVLPRRPQAALRTLVRLCPLQARMYFRWRQMSKQSKQEQTSKLKNTSAATMMTAPTMAAATDGVDDDGDPDDDDEEADDGSEFIKPLRRVRRNAAYRKATPSKASPSALATPGERKRTQPGGAGGKRKRKGGNETAGATYDDDSDDAAAAAMLVGGGRGGRKKKKPTAAGGGGKRARKAPPRPDDTSESDTGAGGGGGMHDDSDDDSDSEYTGDDVGGGGSSSDSDRSSAAASGADEQDVDVDMAKSSSGGSGRASGAASLEEDAPAGVEEGEEADDGDDMQEVARIIAEAVSEKTGGAAAKGASSATPSSAVSSDTPTGAVASSTPAPPGLESTGRASFELYLPSLDLYLGPLHRLRHQDAISSPMTLAHYHTFVKAREASFLHPTRRAKEFATWLGATSGSSGTGGGSSLSALLSSGGSNVLKMLAYLAWDRIGMVVEVCARLRECSRHARSPVPFTVYEVDQAIATLEENATTSLKQMTDQAEQYRPAQEAAGGPDEGEASASAMQVDSAAALATSSSHDTAAANAQLRALAMPGGVAAALTDEVSAVVAAANAAAAASKAAAAAATSVAPAAPLPSSGLPPSTTYRLPPADISLLHLSASYLPPPPATPLAPVAVGSSKHQRFSEATRHRLQAMSEACGWKYRKANAAVQEIHKTDGLGLEQIRCWMANNKPVEFKRQKGKQAAAADP